MTDASRLDIQNALVTWLSPGISSCKPLKWISSTITCPKASCKCNKTSVPCPAGYKSRFVSGDCPDQSRREVQLLSSHCRHYRSVAGHIFCWERSRRVLITFSAGCSKARRKYTNTSSRHSAFPPWRHVASLLYSIEELSKPSSLLLHAYGPPISIRNGSTYHCV